MMTMYRKKESSLSNIAWRRWVKSKKIIRFRKFVLRWMLKANIWEQQSIWRWRYYTMGARWWLIKAKGLRKGRTTEQALTTLRIVLNKPRVVLMRRVRRRFRAWYHHINPAALKYDRIPNIRLGLEILTNSQLRLRISAINKLHDVVTKYQVLKTAMNCLNRALNLKVIRAITIWASGNRSKMQEKYGSVDAMAKFVQYTYFRTLRIFWGKWTKKYYVKKLMPVARKLEFTRHSLMLQFFNKIKIRIIQN